MTNFGVIEVTDHQRIDAISNAHAGREFEDVAAKWLDDQGVPVQRNFSVDVGVGETLKSRRFDLGTEAPPTLVECKSHRWTKGGNVPSAKMTVWNEAMYYFRCAPARYRKILCVLRDLRASTKEALANYYVRRYGHLIPEEVEIWELARDAGTARHVVGP